jgi:sulfonate transport system ATP-binding protein
MNAFVPQFAVCTRGLHRSFSGIDVLKTVDMEIGRGEFVTLLGRSGSGKSTLLRILAGLDDDFDGRVFVPARRAVVFQDARLVPWKRVLPNILLGLTGEAERALGNRLLEEVGLAHRETAWPGTLSGGEAQRVALARALARRPQFLLMDEPFGALDALTRLKIYEVLRALHQHYRPTVLFITHDVDEAILLSDRIMVLTDGAISLDLPNLTPHPRSRSQQAAILLRERLLQELGVKESL